MTAPCQNISSGAYTVGNTSFAVHPIIYQVEANAKEARIAAIQEVTQTYLDSHLGHSNSIKAFSETLSKDLCFISASKNEENAITFKDLNREQFLAGMQKFHFENVTAVRNLHTTVLDVIPGTEGIEDPAIVDLINKSQHVCVVECEQYRLGNGMSETGEGWYKIKATVCFICEDDNVSEDGKLKALIQTIVQLDYTKTKIADSNGAPNGSIKV